mmetsp:Transcript_4263/g.7767  ORF Transcript_4263/g.7767 Transcript_4263/m.7767 type:complete len:83 (-) Transcript_4263:239-487(-)
MVPPRSKWPYNHQPNAKPFLSSILLPPLLSLSDNDVPGTMGTLGAKPWMHRYMTVGDEIESKTKAILRSEIREDPKRQSRSS